MLACKQAVAIAIGRGVEDREVGSAVSNAKCEASGRLRLVGFASATSSREEHLEIEIGVRHVYA